MRLLLIVLMLSAIFVAPLLIFGDAFDVALSGDAAAKRLQEYGAWAWAAGAGLIVADLVLPIPATAVMAALGYMYGTWIGGLVGAIASIIAGLIAFSATRVLGRRAALFLAGERDLQRAETFFRKRGGFAVAMSRPMPLLPEVIACLAGLAGMPFKTFFIALCCGSLPTGAAFAAIGALGIDRPSLALAAGCLIPVLLWAVVRKMLHD